MSAALIAALSPILGGTMKFFLLLVPCRSGALGSALQLGSAVLFGVPFFFWFQLALVPISALAILAADRDR